MVTTDETIRLLDTSANAFASDAAGKPADYQQWTRDFAEQGWLGILVAEERGGLGLSTRHAASIATALGARAVRSPFASLSMAARCLDAVENRMATNLLATLIEGTSALAPAWLWPFEREPGGLAPLLRDGHLNGRVDFVPDPDAAAFLVQADADGTPILLLVNRDDPGTTRHVEASADDTASCSLEFNSVKVGQDRTLALGDAALRAIATANRVGLLLAAAELSGVIAGAMRLTLDYLRSRQQFGAPIGSFQALQHRAVDMFIGQQLTDAALEGALLAEASAGTITPHRALAANVRASQSSLWIVSQALQLHGAIGFASEYALGAFFNRALTLAPWLGSAAQLRAAYAALPRLEASTADESADDATTTPNDWNAMSDSRFRTIVRNEFEANYPPHLRFPARRLRWSENGDWFRSMSAKGWIAPNWPAEHGGMGLSAGKMLAFLEEQERHGIARYQDHGVLMVGPVLMRYGTEVQRREFLPPILRCEHIWCQGYSEPDAGSDLASLKTRAVADGNDYVIDGQKIWTTLAQDATHIFVLARTDASAKPQQGISFILVDITTPGIRIRPIRDIAGHEEFCEVFFDAVRVPKANLVGAENAGWTIAKSLLGFERVSLGSPKMPEFGLRVLDAVAKAYASNEEVGFQAQATQLRIDVAHLADLYGSFARRVVSGEVLGPEVSCLKIVATELFQRIAELIVAAAGPAGGLKRIITAAGLPADCLGVFYKSRPATIYGGSNEIQRNVLAKAVLDLPSGNRI